MAPLEDWKKKAIGIQNDFANLFADRIWDEFEYPLDKGKLWDKIAFALFGRPDSYSSEQKETVDDLQAKTIEYCREKSGYRNIYIGFIFTCTWGAIEAIAPVIRIRYNDKQDVTLSYFLDHAGRVYNTWSKYLDENTWDRCYICVPKDGKYEFNVESVFYNQRERGELVKDLDTLSTITTLTTTGSTLVGLGLTFFPPTALIGGAVLTASTIVGAPAVAYSTGRSVGKLVDRHTHDQSINPFTSGEARTCYLTTAASLLSVATMGSSALLTSSARAGNLVSGTTRALCTTLNITALSINGLGVINALIEVAKKDEVTTLDVLQVTTSIFFFTHSCINFKTASDIIKDAQNTRISEFRQNLSEQEKQVFDSLLQADRDMVTPGRTRVMHGNVKFIKRMTNIENKHEFLQNFSMQPDGQLNINKELTIDPKAFLQMSDEYQKKVLETSKKLQNNEISLDNFHNEIKLVTREYRIRFERQRVISKENICKAFKTNNLETMNIDGKQIFKDLKPHEIDRLDQVLRESCKDYDENSIKLGIELANKHGCDNITEFCALVEYANRQASKEVKAMREQNPNPTRPQGVKVKDYYSQKVYDEHFSNPNKIDELSKNFSELRKECDFQNATGTPQFGNSMAGANHYDKHNFFPKVDPNNNLSPQRYFEIAREMTSQPINNPKWTQNGKSLMCEFHSEQYGAFAVLYTNLVDGKSVIATLMVNNRPSQTQIFRS